MRVAPLAALLACLGRGRAELNASQPSREPSHQPSHQPSPLPSVSPSSLPTEAPLYPTDAPLTAEPTAEPSSQPTPLGRPGEDWFYACDAYLHLVWAARTTYDDARMEDVARRALLGVLSTSLPSDSISSVRAKVFSKFVNGPELLGETVTKYTVVLEVRVLSADADVAEAVYARLSVGSVRALLSVQLRALGLPDLARCELNYAQRSTALAPPPQPRPESQTKWIVLGVLLAVAACVALALCYRRPCTCAGRGGRRFRRPNRAPTSDGEYLKLFEMSDAADEEEEETTIEFGGADSAPILSDGDRRAAAE